jgi:hypothetical protein
MFRIIGVAVLVYAAIALARGEVFARSRLWGRTISREESPEYFWVVLVIYAALGLALIFVF